MLQSTTNSRHHQTSIQKDTSCHKKVSPVSPYNGQLKSTQFIDKNGVIKDEISHSENNKHMATFDRVVLGGHEPSHHFSAGILKMLGIQTGRIFGVWNENAVSSFLAGTRVYPPNSYSYKTINMDRREDFIKHNYFFLNLKHLSEREDFRDPEKVILTNEDDKKFWEQELPRIITDALPSVPVLKEVAVLFNEIGKIIEKKYPDVLDQASIAVNGLEKQKMVDHNCEISSDNGVITLHQKGQETRISSPNSSEESIQGIIDWEFNPMNIKSDKFNAKEVILSISDASRNARNNNRDMEIDDITEVLQKRLPVMNSNKIYEMNTFLKEKYPGKKGGINATQIMRQSIALDILKKLDDNLTFLKRSEYNLEYNINQESVSEACNDPEIREKADRINEAYQELPMWIRRSTYYLPKH